MVWLKGVSAVLIIALIIPEETQVNRGESRKKWEGADPLQPNVCSQVLCSVVYGRSFLLQIPFQSSCPWVCERCASKAACWKHDLISKHDYGGVATEIQALKLKPGSSR